MELSSARHDSGADWLRPPGEQQGLQRYLSTLREHWLLIVLAVLVSTCAATIYVLTAEKVYEAEATLLVTPDTGESEATTGLGLISDSNDPTRDVTTAATLVETPPVARRVIDELGLEQRPDQVLRRVTAEPFAQTAFVSVTAQAPSPRAAADLATAFARQTVLQRTSELRAQIQRVLPELRESLQRATDDLVAASIAARVSSLETLLALPDPTVRVVSPAEPPRAAAAPQPRLSLAAGLAAGLVLGIAAAFARQAFDPRLRREEQLRELYRLPILARVPRERHTRRLGALPPASLSGGATEGYRTLRATLAAQRGSSPHPHAVLVTSSSPSEGKSTTAINLAVSLAQTGSRVILVEADMLRPAIGKALGLRADFGLAGVLIRQVALEDALVTIEESGSTLRLLLVERAGAETADRLSLPAARQLIEQAETLADYVIIDSPPLTEVADALPLAQEVDSVVITARLGRSNLRKLTVLGELLQQQGIQPAGVALIGVKPTTSPYYYARARSQPAEPEPAVSR